LKEDPKNKQALMRLNNVKKKLNSVRGTVADVPRSKVIDLKRKLQDI